MTHLALSLGFALALAAGAGSLAVLLRGRLPHTAYRLHLESEDWRALTTRFGCTRRGSRCGACRGWQALETHHWTYRNLGYEWPWQLVRLCGACHERVHWLSTVLFSRRTAGLWLTTPLVVGWVRFRGKVGAPARSGYRSTRP